MMNKEIQKGDRIFTRLTIGRKVILEFMINRVGSMDELLAEVRQITGGVRGLGRLQVRNQSRGWSQMHNLMFYGNDANSGCSVFGSYISKEKNAPAASGNLFAGDTVVKENPTARRMLFPWESH